MIGAFLLVLLAALNAFLWGVVGIVVALRVLGLT